MILINLMAGSFSASAVTNMKCDTEVQYALSVVDEYLFNNNISLENIFISSPFQVENEKTGLKIKDIYIVFQSDTIIGLLSVANKNEKYYSSFQLNSNDYIQKAYNNKKRIAFKIYDDALYISDGEDLTPISAVNNSRQISIQAPIDKMQIISRVYNLSTSERQISSNDYYYQKYLNVPFVANNSLNGGICWAASIASKCNFKNSSNLSALTVYYDLIAEYNATPNGAPLWVQRGYGLYNVNCTFIDHMVNCAALYTQIYNDNPVDIVISGADGAHQVLICGLQLNYDGTAYYRIRDCNYFDYQDVFVSEEVASAEDDFYYAPANIAPFTSWYWTYY